MKPRYKIAWFDLDVADIPPSAIVYWDKYWSEYAYAGWEEYYGDMSIGAVNFEHIQLSPSGKIEAWFKDKRGYDQHFSWGDHLLTDSEEKALRQKMSEFQEK